MAAHGAEATGFAAPHPTGFATPQRPLPAAEGGKQRTPSGESGYVIMSPGVSGQYFPSNSRYLVPCL